MQGAPLIIAFKYILDFHYGRVGVDTIHSLLPCALHEVDTNALIKMSDELGLKAQRAYMSINSFSSAMMPFMIACKNCIYVATNLDDEQLILYDVATAKHINIKYSEFVCEGMEVLLFSKKSDDERILKAKILEKEWFWGLLKKERGAIIQVAILSLFINLFVLVIPLFTLNVYDRVIPNSATETLFVLSVGVVIFLIFDLIFKSARVYIIESVAKKITKTLEEELLKKTLSLESSHDELLLGSKANIFKELNMIGEFFASKTMLHILDFPFFLIILAVIFMISPPVALVAIIGSALLFGINIALYYPISRLNHNLFEKGQTKQNYILESIKGTETIKLSNALTNRLYKWQRILSFFSDTAKGAQLYQNLAQNLSYALLQLITIVVIIVGVYEISALNLSVGGLIALTILTGRVMVPIVNLSSISGKIRELGDLLNSIDRYWKLPLESERKIQIGVGELNGGITFENVGFAYPKSDYPVLQNCSFKINGGENVGIIGKTGAGKSTIMRLISALELPNSGNIYLDNHNISTLHPVEIRQNMGVMMQEPYLFAGSLAENIGLARPISKENLVKLIEITGLAPLLKKSKDGELLDVGEGGARLSVGQRHLVALARALINNPKILILDEPTSGMDVGLERELMEHIKTLIKDKTLILITHRFAPLELCDRVIVVNDGMVVRDGEKNKILSTLGTKV